MKKSISNIGWNTEHNIKLYDAMEKMGYIGLEIAPTIWIPEQPYEEENRKKAKQMAEELKFTYGFLISSMQSIWYSKSELLFQSKEERENLLAYTKKAIDYASVIGCRNLVFGCPRNRNIAENSKLSDQEVKTIAIAFFKELGDYAYQKGTVLAMEANPPIYHTNFINTTKQAIALVHEVDSKGFLLNLDVGTMIQNEEQVSILEGEIPYINHIHISEPGLKPIEKRNMHTELASLLRTEGYKNYISIEVGKSSPEELEKMMRYVAEVFYD